jgi:metal-sulfur cluster biosynthetic enzyme
MPRAPRLPAELLACPPLEQVWARLDLVMDPELDEPVTDMGFIEAVSITPLSSGQNASEVSVSFRLPTYWCSPNFAFLMAESIKREIEVLPWVTRAVVTLHDHMAADEMNAAINAGRSFGSVFEDLHPGEDLAALRETFDRKAFQRRQEVVIKALLPQGIARETLVDLTLGDLEAVRFEDPEDARQAGRYLALLKAKGLALHPTDRGLPDYDGRPLTCDGFRAYMELLRSVRINMEFSGSLCRGLKASRYKQADLSGEVPILVDFVPADLPDGVNSTRFIQ